MAAAPTVPTTYEDMIIGLLAEGLTPQEIIAFRATPDAQRRVEELVAKERAGTINGQETAELEAHMQFNHLLILLKARVAGASKVSL